MLMESEVYCDALYSFPNTEFARFINPLTTSKVLIRLKRREISRSLEP